MTRPHPLSPTSAPNPAGKAGTQPGAGPAQAKRRGEGPWPHLQQRRPGNVKSMQAGRQGLLGPPPRWLTSAQGQGVTWGQQGKRLAWSWGIRRSASPPAITDLQTADQELSPWGNPLGKVARNPKPHFLRFQCLGRFQNLDRTSVCQTQNRQARRRWNQAASPSGNEHKGDRKKHHCVFWVKDWLMRKDCYYVFFSILLHWSDFNIACCVREMWELGRVVHVINSLCTYF